VSAQFPNAGKLEDLAEKRGAGAGPWGAQHGFIFLFLRRQITTQISGPSALPPANPFAYHLNSAQGGRDRVM